MYKVMIVDDEWLVQEGLKVSLESNFPNIEIVGMASSGREAIEMSAQKQPDIILMDIKMPGINGIEAIENIKRRLQYTKFVIISAYEQFDFAKQAVELGVSHYILKPINQEKLIEVMQRILFELKNEKAQRKKVIENREKLEKALPVLEKGFVYSMLLNRDFKSEIKKYKDLFNIDRQQGFVFVIEFDRSDEERMMTEITMDSLYPKVQNAVKYKCKSVVGPIIMNRMTIVVFEPIYEFEYEQRVHAMDLVKGVKQTLNDIADVDIHIGIGSCCSLEKIKNSLEEANYALSKIDKEDILHYNDISDVTDETVYTYTEIKDDETQIINLMENGKKEELLQAVGRFFRKVGEKFQGDETDLKNVVTELMVMVLSSSYRNNMPESVVGYSTYLSEIRRLEHRVQLENWCLRKIEHISEQMHDQKNSHISNVILKAKDYIDNHFNEDIGLNQVSKEVSISPQYFSSIFKEEMGMNFVEYLREKRIEVAKELLRSKRYSVKEICYEIGYNDPNYFSRLFKKIVGVSPTEYK